MAYASEGLFPALVLNAIITPVLLLIAYVCYNTSSIAALKLWKIYRPTRPVGKSSFFHFAGEGPEKSSLYQSLFRLVDPWIDHQQGTETHIYLCFLRLVILMFLFVGFICAATMMPINVTSDFRKEYFLDQDLDFTHGIADFTTRNLRPKSQKFWLMCGVSYIIAYEVYSAIFKMIFYLKQAKSSSTPPSTAVMFGVPTGSMKEAQKHIWSRIPDFLQKQVVQVEVPRKDVKDMLKTIEKRDSTIAELEHWYAVCEKEGIKGEDRLTHPDIEIRTGWFTCQKQNAITMYREKADKYYKVLREQKEKVDDQEIIGTAYVTFAHAGHCAMFVLFHNGSQLRKLTSVRDVWFAPHPKTIIWENLGASSGRIFAGNVITAATLFFLAILWGTIVASLSNVDNLSRWIPFIKTVMEVHEELKGLISAYLPIIAIAVLNILLPIVMRVLTQFVESVPDKVEREVRVLRKMAVFGLVTTVLLQAAAQGLGDSSDLLNGKSFSDIYVFITKLIVPVDGYFVVFVVQAAFMGNMVRFLRIGDLILGPVMASKAFTHRELCEAYKRKQFYYSEEYAFALITLGFALCFAPNVPYIPFFGFFYFLIRFMVDRAMLLDVYPKSRESDYSMLPCAINCLLGIFLAMQVLSVTVLLAVKTKWDVFGVSCPPIAMTLYVIWHSNSLMHYLMGPDFLKDQLEKKPTRKVLNLPTILDFVTGGPDLTDAPTPGFPEADEEGVAEAVGGDVDAKHAESKIPDLSGNPVSAFMHPCKSFEPVDIDHEEMAAKHWLEEEAEDDEDDSDMDGPYPGIVSTSVFFSNPSRGTPSEKELEMEEDSPGSPGDSLPPSPKVTSEEVQTSGDATVKPPAETTAAEAQAGSPLKGSEPFA